MERLDDSVAVLRSFLHSIPFHQAFIDLQSAYNAGNMELISRVFRLCRPLTSAKDFRHLLLFIRNAFTLLAMMDYPYPTNFMVPLPGHPVAFAADLIMKADTPMEGLYRATALVYNGTQGRLDVLIRLWFDLL